MKKSQAEWANNQRIMRILDKPYDTLDNDEIELLSKVIDRSDLISNLAYMDVISATSEEILDFYERSRIDLYDDMLTTDIIESGLANHNDDFLKNIYEHSLQPLPVSDVSSTDIVNNEDSEATF